MTPGRHDLSAQTPVRGDRTPAHDIWNPKTPRRIEPAAAHKVQTPQYVSASLHSLALR
jgi:hypothetical protein